MIVFLRGEGSVEVFINGVSFGSTILRTANSTSIVIPVSYAVPGKNVELNNAPFLRLNEGVASEIQAEPSKYHSPQTPSARTTSIACTGRRARTPRS